uniref:Uncharacterized protein n=1 Tax=Lactuca sativa TaxID=4236 RepID=A0A9R1XDI4_LACSA|nr:hypothetical protein LSAT_V11C500238620 [Lactuca sativa]
MRYSSFQMKGARDDCSAYTRDFRKMIFIVQNMIDKFKWPLTPATTKLLEVVKKYDSQYTCIFNGTKNLLGFLALILLVPFGIRLSMGPKMSHLLTSRYIHIIFLAHGMQCTCIKLSLSMEEACGQVSKLIYIYSLGIPKKKRKKAENEPNNQGKSLSRKFLIMTCRKCHNKGHNYRSCKVQGDKMKSEMWLQGARSITRVLY